MSNHISSYRIFVLLLLCQVGVGLFGASPSELGTPQIRHFSRQDHGGGTQTWDIQVSNGYVFFGNNEGLLVFDGNRFYKSPLPNGTIVRSVEVVGSKIYVGGQNEFGYFVFSQNGSLIYHSISDDLPPEISQSLTDIWGIHTIEDTLYFQSDHSIIGYHDDHVTLSFKVDPTIAKSGVAYNTLYWYTGDQKLFTLQNGKPTEVADFRGGPSLTPTYLGELTDNSLLLGTLDNGFFTYSKGRIAPFLDTLSSISAGAIYKVISDGSRLYIGTSRDGIYVVSYSGDLINHYGINNGLQNNNVLSLAVDSFGNIWAGLDRGIDFIPASNPFRFLYPDAELRGTGYAALLHQNTLYLGTNNGLYSYDLTSPLPIPKFIENSTGQVWRVQSINDEVYVSHHRGLFQLKGGALEPLSPTTGSWLILRYPGTKWVVEGTYEGLNIYETTNSGLRYKQHLTGFQESSRYLSIQNNVIWVAHPYKGLFKLDIARIEPQWRIQNSADYSGENGLGTDLGILTFQLSKEVLFTGKNGIYAYSENEDSFFVHPDFSAYFDSTQSVLYLTEDQTGDIWFVESKRVGYLKIEETSLRKNITKHILPRLPAKLTGGFEFLLPLPKSIIAPVEEGFVITQREKLDLLSNISPSIQFNMIKGFGKEDTTIFLGYAPSDLQVTLPVGYSSIELDFTTSNKALAGLVQFQWHLEGSDTSWSQWTTQPKIEYRYLEPGTYTVEVRSRVLDQVSKPSSLTFELLQPWYQSTTAVVLFIVLIILILLALAIIPSIRFRLAKRRIEYSKVKAIREKESQFRSRFAQTQEKIDALEAEKMQVEINHQAKELASATMHLVQKGEMLNKIKDNLTDVNKLVADPEAKKQIKKVIRAIEADVNFDETWNNFEHQFDHVHVNFSKRLKEQFPQLTPNDIKLCTYLKLNLSSKEIAALTNISVRGVEISRYRLRKKLGLDTNDNLVEFIQDV